MPFIKRFKTLKERRFQQMLNNDPQDHVSSRDLLRARRLAKLTRTVESCLACRAARTKCNNYRPCSRCSRLKRLDCIEKQRADDVAEINFQVKSNK